MPSNNIELRIENVGQISPERAAEVEASIKGPEQAPRTIDSTGTFVNWQQVRDELGQPFDVERIPIRKLKQMRRDPMFAFGLHYRKTPLVRAQYHFEARDKNGPNAQVAGFTDSAWRRIHARYIFQHTQDFDWGSAQIVRRFVSGNPGGVYEDPTEEDPIKRLKPVWDEGSIDPVIWKPFVGVPLWKVAPVFNSDGEFDGMIYDANATSDNPIVIQQQPGGTVKLTQSQRKIDVHHTLWATNDKDSVFDSIYGYPLLGHGYRFWWSYWFRWAMADRAFERMAVPPLVAYHPEGDYTDPDTNETRPYWEIAAEAAQNLRSNSIATVPSTLATSGIEERGTQEREWSFEFLEVKGQNFDYLDRSFNYLDVMKLRSIWVPEQAFIEGEGGTSSRNVAAQMAEIFLESQANKWEEVAFHINNYIIPQLLIVNFPEFVNNGGTCRIVGHGFSSDDVDFMKQLIQLVGQADPNLLGGVDVREMMRRANIPLLTPEQFQAEQDRIAEQQARLGPPPVPGVTVPLNPGQTNGGSVPEPNPPGSVTGFSDQPSYIYVQPNDVIELSEHDDFLASLPTTDHYKDKLMRSYAVQLRRLYQSFYHEVYKDFAKHVGGIDTIVVDSVELEEGDEWQSGTSWELPLADIELAQRRRISLTRARKAANKLIETWTSSSKRIERLAASSSKMIDKALRRSLVNAQRAIGSAPAEADENTLTQWIESQAGSLIRSVTGTIKDELRTFLINEIMEGKTSEEISLGIQEHFSDFDQWKADRVARSEIRDAFNAGTLFAGESLKLKYAQASDGTEHDEQCRNRNGKLFTIKEAWREMRHGRTHPFCQLSFKLIPRAEFSVETVDKLPAKAGDDAWAYFDSQTCTAYVTHDLSIEDGEQFLFAVAEHVRSWAANHA